MPLRSNSSSLALGAVAVLLGMLSACAPPPGPTPSPTPAFATEEEAFAAAEKVYREYVEAANRGGKDSAFLAGKALESEIETNRYLKANDLVLEGSLLINDVHGVSATFDTPVAEVLLEICVDVSQSRVLNSAGADVTPPSRAGTWLLLVTFVGTRDHLLVSDSSPVEDRSC
ncbi:hypothetical protein [Microbacterium sp. CR_7]|uniref:hypothetical protein n=1 Tax=Microbacterium sp. CR_7 TaxID=3055792 RepID=UPI0035BF27AE